MNSLYTTLPFYRATNAGIKKNIGFIRNDKCASTYFSNIFKANGWVEECSDDIDWSNDQVFSFIMDPYVRHIKGMVEDVVAMGSEKLMLQYFGIQLWHNIPWIGLNSMPMSIKFKDKINSINWIPIDIGISNTEIIVDELLKAYNVMVDWNIDVDRNESSEYEKELFQKFSLMSNSQEKQILLKIICQDYDIYQKSVEKYQNFIDK